MSEHQDTEIGGWPTHRGAPEGYFETACSMWFNEIGLGKPWDLNRMMITCELLGLNVWQLGALCGVRRREMYWMLHRDQLPVTLCLHFRMLEKWFFEVKLGRKTDGTVIPAHFIGQEEKLAELWRKKEECDAKDAPRQKRIPKRTGSLERARENFAKRDAGVQDEPSVEELLAGANSAEALLKHHD